MARLLAWIPLVTGAFATWNDAALPISVPKVSNIGGDQAISAVVGNSYSKDASVSVGVIIIATSEGGSSSVKTWNEPMMAAGTVHQVTVGGEAGLVYSPETINAAVGDMIQFNFMSMNHTVTQSTFAHPCVKMEGGVDSGFVPNPNNTIDPPPMMMFQVTTTDPVWMYCAQKGHCGKGMVFSINPTAEKSHDAFKAAAIAQNGTATESAPAANAAAPSPDAASSSSASAVTSAAAVASSSVAIAPAAASPVSSPSIVQGSGTWSGGQCTCSCLCGAGAFPAGAGEGSWGGWGGSMAITTAAARKRAVRRIS